MRTHILALALLLSACGDDDGTADAGADATCPADNLDDLNQMLPADCGCGAFFDGCVTCEVYVDGEIVGRFAADCRDIICCGR